MLMIIWLVTSSLIVPSAPSGHYGVSTTVASHFSLSTDASIHKRGQTSVVSWNMICVVWKMVTSIWGEHIPSSSELNMEAMCADRNLLSQSKLQQLIINYFCLNFYIFKQTM